MSTSGSEGDHHSNTRETTEKSQADKLRDEKARLRNEIKQLERLNFELECSLNICKFGDIKHLLTAEPESATRLSLRNIPDVETKYMNELFQLAGMYCSHIGENDYVFNFGHSYAIQIINTSAEPKVGKWVMPMSVKLDSILRETALENARDLKPFLVNCKHYIDCYTNRVEQYNELKSVVNNLSGCFLDTSMSYTKITLKFYNMEDVEMAELYRIIVSLIYEPNRVRPHKITIDSMGSEKLNDPTAVKFKTFFKRFRSANLKEAFEKIIKAEDTSVIWKGEAEDELISNNSSASSSELNFETRKRKKKTQQRKPRAKTVAQTSLSGSSRPNGVQNSDSSNSEVDQTSVEPVDKRSKKSVEKKGKKQATQSKGTKVIDVSKKKFKPAKKANQIDTRPGANASRGNLRQSTLAFHSQPAEDTDRTPPSERSLLPGPSGINATKPKAKSNVTVLGNRQFGTSTPVSRLNRSKKRFEPDNTNVSPIRSKEKTVSQEK